MSNFTAGDMTGTAAFAVMSGNVGIGTTGPSQKLHVNGRIILTEGQGFAVGQAQFTHMADNGMTIQAGTGSSRDFTLMDANGAARMIAVPTGTYNLALVDAGGGNVGIGTTSPGGKLDVNGTIYQRGGVLHADYVFEPGYDLETIEEHAAYMRKYKHLKAVPKVKIDENGQEVKRKDRFTILRR